jgi:hypothetical protein
MEVAVMPQTLELPRLTAEEMEAEFLPAFQTAYKTAPFLGSIDDWAKAHVVLPAGYCPPGNFDVNISPYFKEVFAAIKNPHIRQVNVMAPPRSGKTLVGEITLLYLIANSPGNILWIQSTESTMKKMGDARMAKLLRLCPPVERLIDKNDRYAVTQTKYRFANGIEVHLASATLKSLQSFGYKYIVFDECWLADGGLIAEAQARIGDFPNTCKVILISQGGAIDKPDWDAEFNRAPIQEYAYVCPLCKAAQVYTFNQRLKDGDYAGLYWPRNEKTYANREWIIPEASKLAVLKCSNVACKHTIEDTEVNRDYLEKHSLYLTNKETGDRSKISFRINSLAIRKVSFQTLAKEWLEADALEKFTGDNALKDIFIQKRLATTPGTIRTQPIVELDTLDLPPDQQWKGGINTCRFMTVDVQERAPKFWYVIRDWANNSESRKVKHGQANSWEELNTIREQFKVRDFRVLVDSGNPRDVDEIYLRCTQHGHWGKSNGRTVWLCYTPCKGSGLLQFKENGNRPFKLDMQHPNLGKDARYRGVPGCRYVVWSNQRIKRVLEHLRDGKGAKWMSNDNDPEYIKQMCSEVNVRTAKGWEYQKVAESAANEYWDCEAMQVLAALMSGLLTVSVKADSEEKPNDLPK